MTKISTIKYLGQLRTESEHLKSGDKIMSDAPTDNQGKGEAFSPTDMLANSLGTCMITIMGIKANSLGFDLNGMHAEVQKIMTASPRKVAKIVLDIYWEDAADYTAYLGQLKEAGLKCPVTLSLHPDLKQEVNFHF